MVRLRNKIKYANADLPPTSVVRRPLVDRWYGKLLLLLISVILLTLSYAPFKQFWAGWIGLIPLIVILSRTTSALWAAFWWWLAGVLFFSANLWWLLKITGPGVVALVLWLGLYWALVAVVLRSLLRTVEVTNGSNAEAGNNETTDPAPTLPRVRTGPAMRFLLLFPVVWVASEWIRGNWPFQGFSWFNLSYAQTPALHLCQIADIFGEHGISFWVAMINALGALAVLNGWRLRGLLRPVLVVCGVMVLIGVYGAWRFAQTPSMLSPGPTILVVQPNVPQSNTGEKGAPMEELIDFHVAETNRAMTARPETDLVVWSETMMPEMNEAFFASLSAMRMEARDSERARRSIIQLARHYKAALLVGGSYAGRLERVSSDPNVLQMRMAGRRNSAYYFARDTGQLVDRFDKVHLVPFGEYIPFEQTFPWLYRQLIALGPPNMESYQLERGDRAVVFELPKDRRPATQPASQNVWRFVTPICFEDADAELNAWFFRGGAARGSIDQKKADFIVNISNDGWFELPMMPQHLQVGTLRSIENRVPTARSVNTGVSGFIDSLGRTQHDLLIPAYTDGTLVHQIMIDARTTFFTRWGNLLGPACAAGLAVLAIAELVAWRRRRRKVA